MNKKLLTLAVGAALAAGMSVAQAEVAVYGKAHMSIDMQDNDAGVEETFVSDNSSRFGVRASEDLGDGMKVLAQWEMGAKTDAQGPITTNRNAFLGLSGGFGTVRAGKFDTPYKDVGRKFDLFNERVGDSRNVIGLGSSVGAFDFRPNNSVGYTSPNLGPLQVNVLYSVDEGSTAAAQYRSASVSYTGGPLFAALGYEEHNLPALTATDNETGMRLGVGFKTGALTLNAMYETLSDLGGVAGVDRDIFGVGAAFKFGENSLKAQYYVADAIGAADNGGSLMAVGFDHSFSKTVTGYVAYAQADNDPAGSYNVASGNGGHGDVLGGTVPGGSPSVLSAGLEMNF